MKNRDEKYRDEMYIQLMTFVDDVSKFIFEKLFILLDKAENIIDECNSEKN